MLAFAEAMYPGLPLQIALREMLLVGAGAEPLGAAVSTARTAAYRHFSAIARQALAGTLRELSATLEIEEQILRGA